MRLAERQDVPVEAHFTEGELDLEPPEEMAVREWDDQAILEEELDNEDLLEQDVDEDTLEASLEDLVHGGDGDEDDTDAERDEEFVDQDLEESLDLVLLERMALLGDGGGGGMGDDEEPAAHGILVQILVQMESDAIGFVDVAPCGTDEFVCRSCFLVRKRVQLVDAAAMACHDCAT
jgi:hypothetical protein